MRRPLPRRASRPRRRPRPTIRATRGVGVATDDSCGEAEKPRERTYVDPRACVSIVRVANVVLRRGTASRRRSLTLLAPRAGEALGNAASSASAETDEEVSTHVSALEHDRGRRPREGPVRPARTARLDPGDRPRP